MGPVNLPLQWLGKPLEILGSFEVVKRAPILGSISDTISVEDVANAAVEAALGHSSKRIISSEDMRTRS